MSLSEFSRYGAAKKHLLAAIKGNRVAHAYIIEGDHNTDKKGFAIAFAQALLCDEMPGDGCGHCIVCNKIKNGNYEDLYLTGPDDETKGKNGTRSVKDVQIEELQQSLLSLPSAGDRNIAVILSADTMTDRAQTRLLKTLEEPETGTVIMLLSENAENLLPTIRSRCVKLRLADYGRRAVSGMEETADAVLDMIYEQAFFFDIKKKMDSKVKSRMEACAFFDGIESKLGSELRDGSRRFSRERLVRGIELSEKGRTQINSNASYRYVLGNFVLEFTEEMDTAVIDGGLHHI